MMRTGSGGTPRPEDFIAPRFVKELDDSALIRRLYGN